MFTGLHQLRERVVGTRRNKYILGVSDISIINVDVISREAKAECHDQVLMTVYLIGDVCEST